MQLIKKNSLLILTLFIVLTPLVVGVQVFKDGMPRTIVLSLNNDNVGNIPTLRENFNDLESLYHKESKFFLESVNERLSIGEDPLTLESVFISYSDRQPDFPDWVEVQRTFKLVPLIQVSTTLENLPNLAELRYVDSVIPVGHGVLPKISSFTQDSNPYIGEFPLLLNETISSVDADDVSTTGAGVIIAILSTGIDETHPMLDDQDDDWSTNDPKVIDSHDAWEDVPPRIGIDETDDQNGRGTALASIVAGTGAVGGRLETSLPLSYPYPYETDPEYETLEINATINIGTQTGLAPGASLFDVKITNDAGDTYNEGVAISGIEWAVDHGADAILLDDLDTASAAIVSVIEAATSRGALVIVPAGDFTPPAGYDDDYIAPYYTINEPASAPAALTVGATTETNALWVQSERGPVSETEHSKPDVVAPGVFMLGASVNYSSSEDNPGGWQGDPGDIDDTLYFDTFSSTAIAAAVTAGVSARLIESYPGASATAIKIALRRGATDLGFNEMAQGKGKISLSESLNILDAAPKLANNWVGNMYKREFTVPIVNYSDFTGTTILVDGSWGTNTPAADNHDWSQQTNGNLTTLGPSWQHPYDDTQPGPHWYNVSYEGAEYVRFYIDNVTIAGGDNFTIFESTRPNDPNPTIIPQPGLLPDFPWVNNETTETVTSSQGYDNIYFMFNTTGGDKTAGEPVFGMYGSVELDFFASTSPPAGTFEFGNLVTQLTDLGAVVEYWYANSADAPPTSVLLDFYDVYFLGQPMAVNTAGIPGEEYYQWMSGNLTNYLNAGGRVLFVGDYENQYYNNATNVLGVTWHYGGGGGPTTDIANHALTTYPFTIEELLIDAPYTYFTGNAPTLVNESGKATIKYYDQNNGKAVFVADEDVFNDQLWDDPFPTNLNPGRYNNSQLAMNIFYWLTGITYQSGVRDDGGEEHFQLISYEYPTIMTDEDLWEVEFVLQNIGNFTSQAWVAFGFDQTPSFVTLGSGAVGNPGDGNFTIPTDDNADDSWNTSTPDNDIGVSRNNTTIEFFYNISESYPIDQIAMPYIGLATSGMDRETAECYLTLNGVQIGPIYETNTTAGGIGRMYYPIQPITRLQQFDNTIEISIPFSVNLTLEAFWIAGYNFSNSLNNIQHIVTSNIAPNENTTLTFQYTPPDMVGPAYYEPEIIFTPYDMTHAQISPGYASTLFKEVALTIDYGLIDPDPNTYEELNTQVYAIPKTVRSGNLSFLYDITPGSLDSSSSTKIVGFPGDIRVDGLTVMSSTIVDNPSLRLSGTITDIAGLGNYSEASGGISLVFGDFAPELFVINDTWTSQNQLNMKYLNHSSIGPILQVDIPPTQSPTTFSGTLSLFSNETSLYEISLQLTINNPTSSLLLLDWLDLILGGGGKYVERDYNKLWDQLFEMWQIATNTGYDVDSLTQMWYLYGHRTHDDSVSADALSFLEKHVCDIPLEEDLHYEGLIGVDFVDSFGDDANEDYINDYIARGGNLIQLGIGDTVNGDHLGPDFSGDIDYNHRTEEMITLVSGSDSTNPLMDSVDQLFYFGGGYMIVDQESYDEQLTYDVITGQNWFDPGPPLAPNRDIAVIYHDAVYPDRFGYDQGQYTNVAQANKGLKIVVGSASMTQSWFLEQTDYWAYGSMKYAAEQNIIGDIFSVDLGNRKFVENILRVGGNKAPAIESITISTPHVGPGDYVTVRVRVSDDLDDISDLAILCPEKIEPGMDYISCTVDRGEFIGRFPVVDTSLIKNWNIYVIDGLYRITEAVDGVKRFLIPEMNVKPVAWIPFTDEMNFFSIIDVTEGDLLSFAFYYDDFEDGEAITCNVSLVYYLNEEETEIIASELFAGLGHGIFLVDTTNLKSGTYIVFAFVTDTDGGTAEYQLAGFNIGRGTLYKEKREVTPLEAAAPIIVVGGSTIGLAAALGGGWYFLLHKRGMGIRDLFRRGD